jgi:hypothetical protein
LWGNIFRNELLARGFWLLASVAVASSPFMIQGFSDPRISDSRLVMRDK